MRPSAIFIPGARPRSVEDFFGGAQGNRRAAPQPPKAKFLGSDGRELKRPAIQGWACFHDKAFFASGRYRILRPGAFNQTLANGKPKKVWFDHDSRQEVGSTDTGLEFTATAKGLAFRMALSDDRRGRLIYDAVMSNTRPCVSIGASLVDHKVRFAGDVEYDDCAAVDLEEISLIPEGAVADTFAAVVDLEDENPFLSLACREPSFALNQAVANATARGQRVIDRLAQI